MTSFSPLKVLVVDDNVDGARLLSLLVQMLGHEVTTTNNGTSALKASDDFQPDVILLDIGLPDMSGIHVCKNIRQTELGKTVYIVAQTGWGTERDKERTSAAGFDLHLVKPIDPAVLRILLEDLSRLKSGSNNSL